MSQLPKVLFVVPPVRTHADEFEYLIHLPRHAIVLAAELGDEYDIQILDVTAEFHDNPECTKNAVSDARTSAPRGCFTLAPVMQQLVVDRIFRFRPAIVVVHAHAAPHLPIVKLTFDAIIEVLPKHPNMKIVVGGMAATHLAQAIADWGPDGTWIIRGEGTGRVRDLFALLLGKRQPDTSTELITTMNGRRGPVRKHCNGDGNTLASFERPPETTVHVVDIVRNPPIMDYPLPRFDLLPMEAYTRLFQTGDFVPHLEMSSGCTYRCRFCGVHYLGAEGRFRRRPTSNIVAEMRHLRDTFGFDEFYFCDETFTLDKKHARELCKRITEDLPGIRWRCVTRADKLDDDTAQLMFRAGCFEIGFGVEVGNNDVLQENTKDATVDVNVEAIRRVQHIGIEANALVIIGLPQEDHSDIRRTFEFLARDASPDRCQVFVFHPIPGTEYFRMPDLHGLRFDTRDVEEWYKWDHIGEPVCDTKYLSREDIVRYFMLFNRAFATINDPEPDRALVERVLNSRFPVRRRNVTWQLEGDSLRVYRATDASRNIYNNSYELSFSPTESDLLNVNGPRVAEFVLSRCNGFATCSEIAAEVERLFDLPLRVAVPFTEEILGVLESIDITTVF